MFCFQPTAESTGRPCSVSCLLCRTGQPSWARPMPCRADDRRTPRSHGRWSTPRSGHLTTRRPGRSSQPGSSNGLSDSTRSQKSWIGCHAPVDAVLCWRLRSTQPEACIHSPRSTWPDSAAATACRRPPIKTPQGRQRPTPVAGCVLGDVAAARGGGRRPPHGGTRMVGRHAAPKRAVGGRRPHPPLPHLDPPPPPRYRRPPTPHRPNRRRLVSNSDLGNLGVNTPPRPPRSRGKRARGRGN